MIRIIKRRENSQETSTGSGCAMCSDFRPEFVLIWAQSGHTGQVVFLLVAKFFNLPKVANWSRERIKRTSSCGLHILLSCWRAVRLIVADKDWKIARQWTSNLNSIWSRIFLFPHEKARQGSGLLLNGVSYRMPLILVIMLKSSTFNCRRQILKNCTIVWTCNLNFISNRMFLFS
jgi:hypothetical protein